MTALVLTRGDDRILDITVTKPDGTAQDLTGVALRFTAKRSTDDVDADAVITKITPTQIEITSPSGGLAEVNVDAADTEDLQAQRLVWDLQGRDASAKTVTLASGTLTIQEDVSLTSP